MNFEQLEQIASVIPQLLPLMPRIEKATATVQRLMADPEVKDALAVAKEVEVILATLKGK